MHHSGWCFKYHVAGKDITETRLQTCASLWSIRQHQAAVGNSNARVEASTRCFFRLAVNVQQLKHKGCKPESSVFRKNNSESDVARGHPSELAEFWGSARRNKDVFQESPCRLHDGFSRTQLVKHLSPEQPEKLKAHPASLLSHFWSPPKK